MIIVLLFALGLLLLGGDFYLRGGGERGKSKRSVPSLGNADEAKAFRPELTIDVDSSSLLLGEGSPEGLPYFLILDTETFSPIEEDKESAPFPNISPAVALSYQLLSERGAVLKEDSFIIRRSGQMTEAAIALHGISNEELSQGRPAEEAYRALLGESHRASCLVAHNLAFHLSVIREDLSALGLDSSVLDRLPKLCTMQAGEMLGFKRGRDGRLLYPRLDELFAFLYFARRYVPLRYRSKTLRDVRLVSACLRRLLAEERIQVPRS